MSSDTEAPPTSLDVACHVNVLLADVSSDLLPAALDALAEAGYRRMVLAPIDPTTTDVAGLRRTFEARGIAPITIAGQGPGADVSSADPDERAAGAAALKQAVELTAALGGDQMNGVPYGQFGRASGPMSADAFERSAREVGRVADYAHERGVMMTFEVLNRYETAAINTAEQAMQYVEASGSEHLRIHLDTFHMAVEEGDLAAAITHALPKLGYFELGQSGRGRLGTGAVDVADLLRHAIDSGYTGRVGVEAFSRGVLSPEAGDMLAIWRSPYLDGVGLAQEAMRVIRRGFALSTEGRRAARLARLAQD